MTNLTMGDISDPGTMVVKEDVVAFYLGGDTPHVWTAQQVHAQTALHRHPIWVYNAARPGHDAGIIDGHNAVAAAKNLGVPPETSITVDMETHTDVQYVDAFRSVIAPAGFWTSVYGSAATVASNPHWGGGYWVADWTGTPHFTGLDSEWACQYAPANSPENPHPWDLSVVRDATHLWNITEPARETAVLVRLPSGAAKLVSSINGGVTWS